MIQDLFEFNLSCAERMILVELKWRLRINYHFDLAGKYAETSLLLGKLLSMKQSGIFFAPNLNSVLPVTPNCPKG